MDKEKLERLLSDVDMEILFDLKKDLAKEKNKPVEERDEKLISELEDMICKTEEEIISESKKRSLEAVMKMLDEYKEPKHPKIYKRLYIVAACFLVVLGLNTASLKVFGQNMFSAAYHLTKGGITISSEKYDNNDGSSVSESDPYGMKSKCAEYGFFPDTPSYIPEGFVLDQIYEECNDESDIVIFYYNEIPPIGIPTDTYNVTEEQINGHTTYILKEDKQFTAVFIDKKIEYSIFAENLDYNECQKILENVS